MTTQTPQALTDDQKAMITEKFTALANNIPWKAEELLCSILYKSKRETIGNPDDVVFLANLTDILVDTCLVPASEYSVTNAYNRLYHVEEWLGTQYQIDHPEDTFRRHDKIIDAAIANPHMEALIAANHLIHAERSMINPYNDEQRNRVNARAVKVYEGFMQSIILRMNVM